MALGRQNIRSVLSALALLPVLSCNSALVSVMPNDAAGVDEPQSEVGVGPQSNSCPTAEPNALDSCTWPIGPDAGDGGDARDENMPQGDGAQSGSCPAAEPNASDPCTWPTDLQCQYRDPCGAFGCQDTFTCVAGHYLASVCGYALGCSAACGYALGCSAATPKNGDSCACGAGHSAHHPGEGFPCNFACAEGQLIATCDVKTEKWTVSGPAMCTPLADGGGPDAGDGGDASEPGDARIE